MKTVIRIMLLVTVLFAFAGQVSAQRKKGSTRISREQLAERQAKYIAERLKFSSETSKKFTATYLKCQQEVWAVGPRQGHPISKKGLTESQTDSLIKSRFDHSQKLLDIRKKYYKEYRKFLSPKQIERVYELEGKTMKNLSKRAYKRKRK